MKKQAKGLQSSASHNSEKMVSEGRESVFEHKKQLGPLGGGDAWVPAQEQWVRWCSKRRRNTCYASDHSSVRKFPPTSHWAHSEPCSWWALRSMSCCSGPSEGDIVESEVENAGPMKQLAPGTSLLHWRHCWKPFHGMKGDFGLLQGCFHGFRGSKALHSTPLRAATVQDAESTICSCLIAVYKSVNFAYGMSKDSGVM